IRDGGEVILDLLKSGEIHKVSQAQIFRVKGHVQESRDCMPIGWAFNRSGVGLSADRYSCCGQELDSPVGSVFPEVFSISAGSHSSVARVSNPCLSGSPAPHGTG